MVVLYRHAVLPHLFMGGVSVEICRGIYALSHKHKAPVGLIFSGAQLSESGYVYKTHQISQVINELHHNYPNSNVLLGRDHFELSNYRSNDLIYSEIDQCISIGFRHIHLDFNGYTPEHAAELYGAIFKVFERSMRDIILEVSIGNDTLVTDIRLVVEFVNALVRKAPSARLPDIVVLPTGARVFDGKQSGEFHAEIVASHKKLIPADIYIKEHNADFLPEVQIATRSGIIDCFNIAPELGVVQINYLVECLALSNQERAEFFELISKARVLEKWFKNPAIATEAEKIGFGGRYLLAHDFFKNRTSAEIRSKVENKIEAYIEKRYFDYKTIK